MRDNNENDQIFLTLEQLEQYDGREGSPAYVAVDGIIYDVTPIPQWARGVHFGVSAGRDVTATVNMCHGTHILKKLKKIGILI